MKLIDRLYLTLPQTMDEFKAVEKVRRLRGVDGAWMVRAHEIMVRFKPMTIKEEKIINAILPNAKRNHKQVA